MVRNKVIAKYTDSGNKEIRIGKELGRGGEGTVYEVVDRPNTVLKIYHKYDADRSRKISFMSSIKNDRLLKYAAWPMDVAKDVNGKVMGLIMPNATGKEIHKLYSPKNRLSEFNEVSVPFIIHCASNIARSFAVVHDAGQVVGDVNHGNIVVSNDGTVKLIDCDSFQINSKGNLFLCKVGVSTHQPPELQSKSLTSITRTPNHDNFGLAVLIFQLLFMGRHPFSGRYLGTGDMPIEKAIEQCRFAYGNQAKSREMMQPPGTLPLSFYSNEVAELFEKAFLKSGISNSRPKAVDWIKALENLKKSLVSCSLNQAHSYTGNHTKCPWCDYEGKTGIVLFSAIIKSKSFGEDNPGLDIAIIWKRINSITPPYEQDFPEIKSNIYKPSEEIVLAGKLYRKIKIKRVTASILCVLISFILASIGGFGVYPLIIGGAFAVYSMTSKTTNNEAYNELKKGYDNLNNQLKNIKERWNNEATPEMFNEKLSEITELKQLYEQLPRLRVKKIKELEKNLRNRQLYEFLDKFYIQSGNIDSIGTSRKAVLQSYGIETARDINKRDVMRVPGFGPHLTSKLVDWKKSVEQKFTFDPTKGISKSDMYKLEKEFYTTRIDIERQLGKGVNELQYIKSLIINRRDVLKKEADNCINKMGQIKADIDYLKGIF